MSKMETVNNKLRIIEINSKINQINRANVQLKLKSDLMAVRLGEGNYKDSLIDITERKITEYLKAIDIGETVIRGLVAEIELIEVGIMNSLSTYYSSTCNSNYFDTDTVSVKKPPYDICMMYPSSLMSNRIDSSNMKADDLPVQIPVHLPVNIDGMVGGWHQ